MWSLVNLMYNIFVIEPLPWGQDAQDDAWTLARGSAVCLSVENQIWDHGITGSVRDLSYLKPRRSTWYWGGCKNCSIPSPCVRLKEFSLTESSKDWVCWMGYEESLPVSFATRGTLANNCPLSSFWELHGEKQPPSKKEENITAANKTKQEGKVHRQCAKMWVTNWNVICWPAYQNNSHTKTSFVSRFVFLFGSCLCFLVVHHPKRWSASHF